ncbi:MAG: serine--tRNA ligase [Candidatus Paceibacterota bacterium]
MLDINFIRDNKELVERAIEIKRTEFDIDNLLETDEKRRELKTAVDKQRAEKNELSSQIGVADTDEKRQDLITTSQKLKEKLQEKEEKLKEVQKEWQALMLQVPNIPDMSVPEGESEEDNQELKTWGEKPSFDFQPKDHVELMKERGMADFERGTKVHGFRGYFLKGDGAELSWAIWNYARRFFGEKNFENFIAPAIVRKQFLYGSGHLPSEAEDLYETQDEDYLSGTAEIPMMAYHADEVLDKSELPKRYLAFSPCYRREAGSHGKDTKGLMRVHEFYKLEQLMLCEGTHQESVRLHEEITELTEKFLQSLGLPYRQVIICGGDLKKSQVKSYDLELWVPSEERYREIASMSYYHDFQTRRFNIKYQDEEGEKRYVHSLNGTAIATPRVLVALLENNQQADGSITIPEVLHPFMNKKVIY